MKLPLTDAASLVVRDTQVDGYHILIRQKGKPAIKITKEKLLKFTGPALVGPVTGLIPISLPPELTEAIIKLVNGSINLEDFINVYRAIHPTG